MLMDDGGCVAHHPVFRASAISTKNCMWKHARTLQKAPPEEKH